MPDPDAAFQRAADWLAGKKRGTPAPLKGAKFHQLPAEFRLALEMAANEDVERRALEGELRLLEAAWHDAEEVAKIADDMFLPEGTDARLEDLRNPR